MLALFAILGLLLPGIVRSQERATEPVPSGMLRDGELVVESHDFAVGTPAGDWQWYLARGQGQAPLKETYICVESASGAEFQVLPMGVQAHLDTKFVKGFTEGVTESLTAGGLQVVSMDVTDSGVPLPGSRRSRWHALRPDGTSIYGYGYLTQAGTVYVLLHVTPDAEEPPEFVQFVKTFRTLRAPPPRVVPGSPMAVVYLLLVGIPCTVAWQVNRIRGRTVLNGGTIAAVLVILLLIILFAIGGYIAVSTDQPPEKIGEYMGRRVGEALIPLLTAILVSRAVRRRNGPGRHLDGEPPAAQER